MTAAAAAELTPRELVAKQLREAREERDLALRTIDLEESQRGGWDRSLIDTAIRVFASTGQPFSANDVREELPSDVRPSLIGARFMAASVAGEIRKVGLATSTKKNTHAKDVALWVRASYGGDV